MMIYDVLDNLFHKYSLSKKLFSMNFIFINPWKNVLILMSSSLFIKSNMWPKSVHVVFTGSSASVAESQGCSSHLLLDG